MSTTTDEASNDVMIVDSNEALLSTLGESAGKPLMMLFLRLIGNDSKQNTILTNAQIIDILQKEFEMDIVYTHELEIEIYLNLLKRFLKDWPQWDEFDFAINTLKDQKDIAKMKDMLQTNYESLKEYLRKTLEAVAPMLKTVIQEVIKSTAREPTQCKDNVAIIVQCTRMQLNSLFFRRPHPELNHTILNMDTAPAKIRLQPFAFESIFNWPLLRINLTLAGLVFRREIKHVMNHVLINKKLNYASPPVTELKTNFQVKAPKITNSVDAQSFIDLLGKVKELFVPRSEEMGLVCDIITKDLEEAPRYVQSPASYRQNLTKYPYVRYLNAPVDSEKFSVNNYDLQLEETAIPQLFLHFVRYTLEPVQELALDGSFLTIECMLCECKYPGLNSFSQIQQHFEVFHGGELDWQCMHCKQIIGAENLAKARWQHECNTPPDEMASES